MYTELRDVAELLMQGGVGVLPTDTLYGLVGSALDPDVVARIYDLKERDPEKPLIVLISDIEQLESFGVVLSDEIEDMLGAYWPGPNTLILPTVDEQFSYIDRGTGAIAFRLPASEELRDLIREVGPLVAPSANKEGMPPARNTDEAKQYFGTDVDFYVDGGDLDNKPSTIIAFDGDEVITVRG